MATNFWICYEPPCNNYRGPESEFKHPDGGHECPKCKTSDACFPWRKFRCLGCGHEDEQGKFFAWKNESGKEELADLDPEPMEEKWEYDCSQLNNGDCDSTTFEQIDDSTEPPKQKLYCLRVKEVDGVRLFSHSDSGRASHEISFFDSPVGTRVVLKRHDEVLGEARAQIIGTHASLEAFIGSSLLMPAGTAYDKSDVYDYKISASSEHVEEYDDLLLYICRNSWGHGKDWSPDQWFENMTKANAETAAKVVKDEQQAQRDLVKLESMFKNRRELHRYIIRHGKKSMREVLNLAKKMFERRKAKNKKKKR